MEVDRDNDAVSLITAGSVVGGSEGGVTFGAVRSGTIDRFTGSDLIASASLRAVM